MTIHFECDEGFEKGMEYETLISKVIEASLDYEKCPYEVEINVVLTGNKEIHQINREFRNIDRATDVLSFPMIDYAKNPADFDGLEDCLECFNPETGELLLGDIMISIEQAKIQAEEYNHSFEREIAFLTAHSMLHLCGYDHMEEEERVVMEQKQEEILTLLGITRE